MGSTPSFSETSLSFHGAEYVFVGVAFVSGSLTLDSDSAFFFAICNDVSECLALVKRCGSAVSYVKVGSVVYRYNRLPCVDRNTGTETSISICLDFTNRLHMAAIPQD